MTLWDNPCNTSSVHLVSVSPLQVYHRKSFGEACVGHSDEVASPPDLGSLDQSVDTGQASSREDFGVRDFVTPRDL